MRLRIAAFFLVPLLALAAAPAPAPGAAPGPGGPAAELSTVDAAILGVIEGVTEFLPISSTGHLIVATRFLGLESEVPLKDAAGQPLWHKPPSPKHPEGIPLTLKLAADTYNVVLQFGAIAAVALLYWTPLWSMARGLFGLDPAGRRLLVHVMIAFLPAAVVGFLAHDWIDRHLFSVGAVIVAQVAGAGLMFYAEAWRRRRLAAAPAAATDAPMTAKSALLIGGLQCVAMWPGTSRSMMTIVGGYFAGLNPRRAAEFSFLLGFVTLSAASCYKALKSGGAVIQVFGWSHALLGGAVAAVTAAVCVRFLVHWLTRHGLAVFAWYRLALAAVLGVVFYL